MSLKNGTKDKKEDFLFKPEIMKNLDYSSVSKMTYKGDVSPQNIGGGLYLRPLKQSDYEAGFLDVLRCLTEVGEISPKEFHNRFEVMKSCPNTYYVIVVEDRSRDCVVAAATLVVEHKFIRKCAMRGHIEDVAVLDAYQGKQLGKILIDTLVVLAHKLGVYKVSLDCKEELSEFYKKAGFEKRDCIMYLRF